MDISFIITSITKDYNMLDTVIDSIIRNCPYTLEVIIVSPHEIKNTNITLIKDDKCNGSCYAFNLGAIHSSGKYLACGTDDTPMREGWWECVDYLKQNPFCSFRTGEVYGRYIPHTFSMTREFYEGDVMKKHIFNPALFHMYLDVDLGYALAENGITFPTCHKTCIQAEKEDKEKTGQKHEFYRVDGMIFNRMWNNKYAHFPLFHVNPSSDEELEKIVEIQLEKNIFKQFN